MTAHDVCGWAISFMLLLTCLWLAGVVVGSFAVWVISPLLRLLTERRKRQQAGPPPKCEGATVSQATRIAPQGTAGALAIVAQEMWRFTQEAKQETTMSELTASECGIEEVPA